MRLLTQRALRKLGISQFQLRPSRIVSPGGRAEPRASSRLLTHPRGFWLEMQTWRILSENTSSLSPIGLSIKDWTKLWRLLNVCFLDFLHFRIAYQATTWAVTRERLTWIHTGYFAFKTYATISRGWGICPLISGDQTNTHYVTVSVYRTTINTPTSQSLKINLTTMYRTAFSPMIIGDVILSV